MKEAYEIGVKLLLDDKIIGTLGGVKDQFKMVQDAVAKTNAMLKDTIGLVSGIAGAARSMASAWQSAASAAERMAAAAGGARGGGGGSSGGGGLFIGGGGQEGSDEQLRLPGPGMSIYGPGGGGGGGSSGGGGRGAFGDGISPMHIMSGIFVAQAGAGMLSSVARGVTSPSFDIADQQNNIRNLTPNGQSGDAAVSQAMAAAIKIQQNPANPGITIGQALALIGDTYSVDRNMENVSAIAPALAADAYRMSRIKGGAIDIDQIYTLVRSSEELGKLNLTNKDGSIDTSKATGFIDQIARLVVNSNGNLSASGILTMVGQMGPGGTQLSDDALAKAVIAQQAMGASQVGTGLNAMTQEFIGGKMSQSAARSLHEAGVLPDYMFGKDGKILTPYKYGINQVMLPPGVLKDEPLALTNPLDWIKKDLVSGYLNPDGSVKDGEANKEGLIAALNRDFSRIPGMKLAGLGIFNAIVQDRALQNSNDIASNGRISANDANTPNAQAAGVGAALNAFIAMIGNPEIPAATKFFAQISSTINAVSNAGDAHPGIVKGLDDTAIGGVVAGAALAGRWALKKFGLIGAGDASMAGSGAAGAVGDFVLGPGAGIAALMQASIAASHKLTDMLNGTGLDGRDLAGGTGSASDPIHVIVTNGIPLTAQSPTMPTGPTAPNSATTPRMPGAVNRLSGHQ